MSKPDLEKQCWAVHGEASKIEDAKERVAARLKALELLVKIRCAGEKVKGGEEESEDELTTARRLMKVPK